MSKNMLIDAAHAEETRVVVLAGDNLEEFDVETKERQQIRGNIYLAKATRVEPSLQACFVDFGSPRHGFLAFSEVHPDYYQIPMADREALIEEEAKQNLEDIDEDDESRRAFRTQSRKYKIQDVLRRRQIMLVQAVKEERGNKGAALTTYLSLAGRYCVLMPNTPRGGGISRKIAAVGDRKRLKSIVSSLEVPKGMGLIIRTAGAKRNKTEIKRDYEYLLRLWDDIRTRTLESIAPSLIHEEESLVKRAIRDLYDKDVSSIIIEGERAYKEAKDFVKMLIPSHARKVHLYKNSMPLFSRMGVDKMLSTIHNGVVQLKSGGYIVINQTEALVAVDVNSGRSTRERSIEQTALKTNLEAADEVAKQMRMRDLAGLIVIDFIDMDDARNDRAVEKRMKDVLRLDRARVQMGKISNFGLMEISRQRRRTGVLEGSSHICETCQGFGRVRSPSSAATQILREMETKIGGYKNCEIVIKTDTHTAFYILNEKRVHLAMLETERGILIRIIADDTIGGGNYEIDIITIGDEIDEPDFNFNYIKDAAAAAAAEDIDLYGEDDEEIDISEDEEDASEEEANDDAEETSRNKRRRPRRRGRRGDMRENDNEEAEDSSDEQEQSDDETQTSEKSDDDARPNYRENRRYPRRRRGRRNDRPTENSNDENGAQSLEGNNDAPLNDENHVSDAPKIEKSEIIVQASEADEKPVKPRRNTRKPKAEASNAEDISIIDETTKEAAPKKPAKASKLPKVEAPIEVKEVAANLSNEPRKTGWWARNASKLFGVNDDGEA